MNHQLILGSTVTCQNPSHTNHLEVSPPVHVVPPFPGPYLCNGQRQVQHASALLLVLNWNKSARPYRASGCDSTIVRGGVSAVPFSSCCFHPLGTSGSFLPSPPPPFPIIFDSFPGTPLHLTVSFHPRILPLHNHFFSLSSGTTVPHLPRALAANVRSTSHAPHCLCCACTCVLLPCLLEIQNDHTQSPGHLICNELISVSQPTFWTTHHSQSCVK